MPRRPCLARRTSSNRSTLSLPALPPSVSLCCGQTEGHYELLGPTEPVELLELTLVQVEYLPCLTDVRTRRRCGRSMKRGTKRGEACKDDDCDGGGGGSGSKRAHKQCVDPATATRELERNDRLFQRAGPQKGGDAGDSFLECPAVRADCEMRLEEDGLEVRELVVGAQRQLLTGPCTIGRQYRPLSHPTFRRVEGCRG
jgi:hypothetical protein